VNISVKPTAKEHIRQNRDYHNNAPWPGYKPYPYPHPLQRQWPPSPPADAQPPSAPEGLAAQAVGHRDVELRCKASTDDLAVAG
jgi:hypothetical protein